MQPKVNKVLALLCHPYLFALKEGNIVQNPFDYSLLLMQRNCTEVIKSPDSQQNGEVQTTTSMKNQAV